MAGLIYELIDLLNQQTDLYEELLLFSNQKKELIIKNKIDDLKHITNLENICVGKAQKLDKRRGEYIADIAIVLNEKESNITLSSLANIIKEQAEYEVFLKTAKRFQETLQQLKIANDNNRILLESSLEYIEFNINVIRSTFNSQPTIFTSKGEVDLQGQSFLDIKN